jgi:hypothetical protein
MANKILKVSDDVTNRASQLLNHDLLKKRNELGDHLVQLFAKY